MRLRYNDNVVHGLRQIALAIERGDLDGADAVVVTGGLGELNVVHALGSFDAYAALGALSVGQHILLNAVMPDGNTTTSTED